MTKPNGILAMNPEEYREIDGVVFDRQSYARHCNTQNPSPAPTQTVESAPPLSPPSTSSSSPLSTSSSPACSPAPSPVSTAPPSVSSSSTEELSSSSLSPSRVPDKPDKPSTTPAYQKPTGILAMNPDKYREMDGVVFDLEHYARHCQSTLSPPSNPVSGPPAFPDNPGPAPVFAMDPYHIGWYETDDEHPPIPIMGGALPPAGMVLQGVENGVAIFCQTVWICHGGSGSGSGSYMTSYVTSYRTSWVTSGSFGSFGSFGSDAILGWYECGSVTFPVRGYGLELV